MKNIIYKWAKSYVERFDDNKREREEKLLREKKAAREKFNAEFNQFRRDYLERHIDNFKMKHQPEFKVGEIVTTNWYGRGNSWDGNVPMMQQHTLFRGPIDVEIADVSLDTSELIEIIDQIRLNGDMKYGSWERTVDEKRKTHDISWSYRIKIPGDDTEYWRYLIRENKFINKDSLIAKHSKAVFADEMKLHELRRQEKELEKSVREQIEIITGIKVIIR